jgi:hypothetical protein
MMVPEDYVYGTGDLCLRVEHIDPGQPIAYHGDTSTVSREYR